MHEVTDEMLMAMADGEVAYAGERLLAESDLMPAQRARLAMYKATRAPLAEAYRPFEEEAVPNRLLDAVTKVPIRDRSDVRAPSPGLMQVIAGWFASPGMRTAFAGLAGIAIGIGGMLLSTSADRPVPTPTVEASSSVLRPAADGRVLAAGVLARTLEGTAAGKGGAVHEPGHTITSIDPRMTFLTSAGYCRQYELATAEAKRFGGIGCRDGEGVWTIHAHVPLAGDAGAQTDTRVASTSAELLAAMIDKMSSREALEPDEEAAVMARGWRQ